MLVSRTSDTPVATGRELIRMYALTTVTSMLTGVTGYAVVLGHGVTSGFASLIGLISFPVVIMLAPLALISGLAALVETTRFATRATLRFGRSFR